MSEPESFTSTLFYLLHLTISICHIKMPRHLKLGSRSQSAERSRDAVTSPAQSSGPVIMSRDELAGTKFAHDARRRKKHFKESDSNEERPFFSFIVSRNSFNLIGILDH